MNIRHDDWPVSFMKILLAYYSRTGFTRKVMEDIQSNLERRGHTTAVEALQVVRETSCVGEIWKDLHHYPLIFLSSFKASWREKYLAGYAQIEEDISPLRYPDVSAFDRICIGSPKWAQISYPVARYLRTVRGLAGKKIGSVATFGGPPLPVFELAMIEKAMTRMVSEQGASIIAHLGLSSAYHELGVMPLFRCVSRIVLHKPIEFFMIGSEYANHLTRQFCDRIAEE
ncbi:MAG: flavodoxin family protein [Syntrophaceae bacterium]|nr:flavodoxin family protein [Syntrophaceae bacterium]